MKRSRYLTYLYKHMLTSFFSLLDALVVFSLIIAKLLMIVTFAIETPTGLPIFIRRCCRDQIYRVRRSIH